MGGPRPPPHFFIYYKVLNGVRVHICQKCIDRDARPSPHGVHSESTRSPLGVKIIFCFDWPMPKTNGEIRLQSAPARSPHGVHSESTRSPPESTSHRKPPKSTHNRPRIRDENVAQEFRDALPRKCAQNGVQEMTRNFLHRVE